MKKFSYGKRPKYTKRRRVYRRTYSKFNSSPRVTGSFRTKHRKNEQFMQRGGNSKTLGYFNTSAPFPEIAYTTHRYAHHFTLYADNITGLIGVTQTMRLNNLYDPDNTGVGHQASGFDQMAYIYGRYVVYAVNVNIRTYAADGQSSFLAIAMKPPVASTSAWVMAGRKGEDIIETQNGFVLDCPNANPVQQWSTGWRTIGDLIGVDQSQVFNDVSYMGSSGTGAGAVVDMVIGAGTYGMETGKYVKFVITIDFKAKWTQRNCIEQS